MEEKDWLVKRFDETGAHLRAVAHRMLGSASEADDALQEAWLKLSRADTREVNNVAGWLTTVVARVCLDMLRSRRSRREEPLVPAADAPSSSTVETEVGLADAIGPALLVVLDMLAPQERVAFVLHDMFDLSFEEIAPSSIAPLRQRGSSPVARDAVRGAAAPAPDPGPHRELISAFLAASRDGDFERLVAVLSPDVVLRADDLAVRMARRTSAIEPPPGSRDSQRTAGCGRIQRPHPRCIDRSRRRRARRGLGDGRAGARGLGVHGRARQDRRDRCDHGSGPSCQARRTDGFSAGDALASVRSAR